MAVFEWCKILIFALCSRFVDYELTRAVKFSLWDSCLRQIVNICVCSVFICVYS